MSSQSVKSCPKCNLLLSKVTKSNGDLLGYFCKGTIVKTCDYIDCISTKEYDAGKRYKSGNQDKDSSKAP